MRPIIIITFGTTNVVVHNAITFVAGIGIGIGKYAVYLVMVLCQHCILQIVTGPSDSTTFGARPIDIVTLVPYQA